MLPLTKRQREVLTFIETSIAANGYAPSLAEIGAAMSLRSLATVSKHLTHLVEKGAITRRWNRSRSIAVSGVCPTCGHSTPDSISMVGGGCHAR